MLEFTNHASRDEGEKQGFRYLGEVICPHDMVKSPTNGASWKLLRAALLQIQASSGLCVTHSVLNGNTQRRLRPMYQE